ncbi:MAG: hypothetical protein WBA36_13010 [Mesorhizobium sp.]
MGQISMEISANPGSVPAGNQQSIYSVREALGRSCRRIGSPADAWWKGVERNIVKNEPFIQFLHVDYNRDKHGEGSGVLVPSIDMGAYSGAAPDMISGEGVFTIQHKGSINRRRVFFPAPNCKMTIRLEFEKQVIRGHDIGSLSFVEKLNMIIEYYEDLIKDAKVRFPD